MRSHGIGLSALVCAVACLSSGCSWLGLNVEPREAGLDDLVIYDPGRHENGLPAIEFKPSGDGLKIEIPPAVHVHRYYYSGDKEFQGPIIPGGPTVIVANNPFTGKRMYIETVLPAGAPVIAHNKHSITYVYPDRRVEISFSWWNPEIATVKFLSGKGIARHIKEKSDELKSAYHEHIEGSEVYRTTRDTAKGVGEMVMGVGEAAGTMASTTLELAKNALNIVPGVAALRGMAEDAAQRRRDAGIRLAEDRKKEAEQSLPTNR